MKKYYLIGLLVFLTALFAYHFIAANQAEEQINEALQEQASNPRNGISVQYSSIEVSPFSGNIEFDDITIIQDAMIRRSKNILVDLGYIDFLSIYIGGLQFGLEHLSDANLSLIQASQVNRNTLSEIKFDTLAITYNGNVWDVIQQTVHDSSFKVTHSVRADGKGLRLTRPDSQQGSIKSRTMNFNLTLSDGTDSRVPGGNGDLNLETISWTPTPEFQQNYSFFIKGFGFETDFIPVDQANFSWQMEPSLPGFRLTSGEISTELCKINLDGKLVSTASMGKAKLEDVSVSISDFSEQFSRVLENMEKLLNISLPKQGDRIVFRIGGTLEEPVILNN